MDLQTIIFSTIGGLGLFLFGMDIMSDALKKAAGNRLKQILESLTKNRLAAVFIGTSVTALIQSSSATTVMLIGIVNAGLLPLKQALCVVMGANIGTTITAWLVSMLGIGAFKITLYTMPMVALGFLMRVVGRTAKIRNTGNFLLGLGILFIGIEFMKEGSDPLGESEKVKESLIWIGENPLLAVLAGTLLTCIIQSSSASIAMIQLLAFNGAFGTDWDIVLRVVIPFVLGNNIGTTITAQIAALQANRNSKRVAMGHTIFNIIGVIYILPLAWKGWFADWVELIAPFKLSQQTIMPLIAVAHTSFNVINTIIFIPIVGLLEKAVLAIIPVTKDELEQKPVVLEKHLLDTPEIAIDQARREILRMADRAMKNVMRGIEAVMNNDLKKLGKIRMVEENIDEFQYEITAYLSQLATREVSDTVSVEIPVLLHTINDLERIGDHAINLTEIAQKKIEQKLSFSDEAMAEAQKLKEEISDMFDDVILSLKDNNVQAAGIALNHEQQINKMQHDYRQKHVQRMTEGKCSAITGLVFIDLVDNVEKIGDHLTNIAQAVMGGLQWDSVEEQKQHKPKKPSPS